ncbi:MAG: hypothetical protein Q4A16_09720 [Lautropia sp.]|nr:hypothetical protein [Lautropia sp.]
MNALLLRTRTLLPLSIVLLLSACGGGGGGGSNTDVTGSGGTAGSVAANTTTSNALQDQAAAQAATEQLPANSYWTMDGYRYPNGGYSHQQDGQAGDKKFKTLAISTASMSGGTDTGNGPFTGSVLAVLLSDSTPGSYTITNDKLAVVDGHGRAKLMHLEVHIGTGVTTGSTLYTATSGTVDVTLDAAGKLHLTTPSPLPTVKTLDTLGGVQGAPDQMMLNIHNAY